MYEEPRRQPNAHYEPSKFVDRICAFTGSAVEHIFYYGLRMLITSKRYCLHGKQTLAAGLTANFESHHMLGIYDFSFEKFIQRAAFMFADRIDLFGWHLPSIVFEMI